MSFFSVHHRPRRAFRLSVAFACAVVSGTVATSSRAAVAEPSAGPSSEAGPPAISPEAKAIANQRLEDGVRAFRQGRFSDALEAFEKARDVYPSPQLWFDIAQSHKELGHDVEALRAFARFRDEALGAPSALRAEALTSIDALQRKLARLSLHVTIAGGKAAVDDRELGPSPRDEEVWVKPGHHVVTVVADSGGVLFRKELDVEAGARALVIASPPGAPSGPVNASSEAPTTPALDLSPRREAAPPPEPGSERPFYRRPAFWIVTGAVVLLAAGATTWLLLRPEDRCGEITCL